MPVSRLELTSIEARRFTRPHERVGQIKIDHSSTVTLIQELEPGQATIEFRYTATYGPLGVIRIEGSMVWSGDAKTLGEQWRTTGQMAPQVASEIHTAVMRACVPQAVGVAKDLQLPPPIPLPQVQFQQPAKSGGASVPGPEVM